MVIYPRSLTPLRLANTLFKIGLISFSIFCSKGALAVEVWEQAAVDQFTQDINAIVYGGSQFVAVGAGGFVATSEDGIEWVEGSLGNSSEYEAIAYGNGRFVAVGELAPIVSSTDGISWQEESVGISTRISGAAFGNGQFLIFGGVGGYWTSTDGQTWTKGEVLTTSSLTAAVYGDEQFIIVSRGGRTLNSANGLDWILNDGVSNTHLTSVTYGNFLYVATSLGGEVFTSFNGIDWVEQTVTDVFMPLRGIAFGNGHFSAVGDNGGLWTSTDSAIWTQRSASASLKGVAFHDGRFIAVGDDGTIIRSSNEAITPAPSRFINLSNRAFVGVGDEILIGSLILLDWPLRIYARVGGPALGDAGIENFLENPTIELVKLGDPNTTIDFNDDWRSDQESIILSTGIPPTNDSEPALVATLDPGLYSVIVRGVEDSTGFANVEIYEFRDPSATEHGTIVNLSNRAFVGTGDDILIGSMIIQGALPKRIYTRVAGFSLADAGISNYLVDPTLELIRLGTPNVVVGTNDNWMSDQASLIVSTSIPPGEDNEAAIVAALTPGTYSIVVRGVNDGTGFSNVELYDFD